ncbi:SRPBCC domain-containing protein [Rhodococcus sp. NPDC058521]|uniref:SRPBCC family protein n=1 Tax=Rhodococcus sp. NPDC058521 TaxID=3346536 RepID=UPI003662143B
MTDKQFTIVRNLDATPQQVWDAWTRPALMAEWMHPKGVRTARESVSSDVRVDGRYAYTMVHETTGTEYPVGGRYLELDPPKLLVCTWGAPEDPEDTAARVTVRLDPSDTGTRMTFTCAGIDAHPGDDNVYDGWSEALENLGLAVAATT